MSYDFNSFKQASLAAIEALKKEYSGIRTNQATPAILDGISVDAYGANSNTPINQLASVVISGPKSLLITPWDKEVGKSIDKAIRESNLGLSVALDAQGIRVSFPDLTNERRTLLIKTMKEKLEDARIRIRNEREKNLSEIDKSEKDGTISKDDKFKLRADLQKLVDEANAKLEEMAAKKEKEISE